MRRLWDDAAGFWESSRRAVCARHGAPAGAGNESIGGRGGIDDLNIVLGGEPEEALEARAGMLGAHTLEAVRQQEHEATELLPFVFAARDELIDDWLRDIPEIAELRFPKDEGARAIEAETIFESEHARFAERAVDDFNGAGVRKMLQREIFFARFVIVQNGVAMAEGAALAVLATQADAIVLGRETGEGERFGGGPIERVLRRWPFARATAKTF